MKVLSKGEPVSNEEALASIRRRLKEKRSSVGSSSVSGNERDHFDFMDIDGAEMSKEQEEWMRRFKKLSNFSIAKESLSDNDKDQINFLESVDRYLSSLEQQI